MCCTRRSGKFCLSLGRLSAGRTSRICGSLENGARTCRSLFAKRVRTFQSWRQRARMVFGLVRRRILRLLTRTKSIRTASRCPPGIARRLLAAPHQGHAHRSAFQHPSRVQVCGLWISHRAQLVAELAISMHSIYPAIIYFILRCTRKLRWLSIYTYIFMYRDTASGRCRRGFASMVFERNRWDKLVMRRCAYLRASQITWRSHEHH